MENDQQHNSNPDNPDNTAPDDKTTLQQPHASTHPEKLSAQDQQHPPTNPDTNASAAEAAAAKDFPIIDRRRPSEAETKLLREYGGKEHLQEKTKLAYNERDIDPGADTPQEEKSFAEGVVGEMYVEAHERKFHLGGFEKGVKKSGKS
ncbi:hypothetical protein KC330_g316 [Hortaea werneckii]|nr:hypothetical protein KC330_g316 [Hortaea werneckii]